MLAEVEVVGISLELLSMWWFQVRELANQLYVVTCFLYAYMYNALPLPPFSHSSSFFMSKFLKLHSNKRVSPSSKEEKEQ